MLFAEHRCKTIAPWEGRLVSLHFERPLAYDVVTIKLFSFVSISHLTSHLDKLSRNHRIACKQKPIVQNLGYILLDSFFVQRDKIAFVLFLYRKFHLICSQPVLFNPKLALLDDLNIIWITMCQLIGCWDKGDIYKTAENTPSYLWSLASPLFIELQTREACILIKALHLKFIHLSELLLNADSVGLLLFWYKT